MYNILPQEHTRSWYVLFAGMLSSFRERFILAALWDRSLGPKYSTIHQLLMRRSNSLPVVSPWWWNLTSIITPNVQFRCLESAGGDARHFNLPSCSVSIKWLQEAERCIFACTFWWKKCSNALSKSSSKIVENTPLHILERNPDRTPLALLP